MRCTRSMPRCAAILARSARSAARRVAARGGDRGARREPWPGGDLEIHAPTDRAARDRAHDSTSRRPATGPRSRIVSTGEIDIPFFGWFFRPLVAHRSPPYPRATPSRRSGRAIDGRAAPPPAEDRRRPPAGRVQPRAGGVHRDRVGRDRGRRPSPPRSSVSSTSPISHTFGASDATIGVALALSPGSVPSSHSSRSRIADRRGRRRSILIGVVGLGVRVRAVGRSHPTDRVPHRRADRRSADFVGTTGTVAFIAVVEEAPEGARRVRGVDARARGRIRLLVLGRDVAVRRHRHLGLARALRRSARATIVLAPTIARNLGETDALHRARGPHRRRARPGARRVRAVTAPLLAARARRLPRRASSARRRRSS